MYIFNSDNYGQIIKMIKIKRLRILFPGLTLSFASAFCVLLGAWTLSGWLPSSRELAVFFPSMKPMSFSVTFGFLLCALGLLAAACSLTVRRVEKKSRELEAEKIRSKTIKQMAASEHRKTEIVERTLAEQTQELLRANAELKDANERLNILAHIDPLTNFLNRRGLQRALTREIAWARRQGTGLVVILMDLDNLKGINDKMGYAVGDIILKEVALKIKEILRASDIQGRIGGDEFMIFLPQTKLMEGMRIAEKLRLAVSETPVFLSSGSVKVSASLGVVNVSDQTISIDELLSKSHLYLNRSKRDGKNRVSTEGEEARTVSEFERSVAEILDAVDKEKAVRAVKQAIYTLEDENVIGYEFLSRMSVPGFEMPDEFFPVCTEAKILPIIDRACFKTCFKAAIPLAGGYQCHINIFPSTMLDIPVKSLVGDFHAGPSQGALCVEISEQQIIGDPAHLSETVREFKEAGVRVAIDDVGFGKTSLESIILLDPDIMKIDKRCVIGISRDPIKARTVERLLRIAVSLRIQVIAEGIETREDLEALKRLGVRYGQGFLWGKPA